MVKTLKILVRCLFAALVLFFTISSRSMAVTVSFSSDAIYSANMAPSSHVPPFMNYSSKRYAANRLVETPAPPSLDVHPVLGMPLPVQTGLGVKMTAVSSGTFSSPQLLPLRI